MGSNKRRDDEAVVSTASLEVPPESLQETEVELWGLLSGVPKEMSGALQFGRTVSRAKSFASNVGRIAEGVGLGNRESAEDCSSSSASDQEEDEFFKQERPHIHDGMRLKAWAGLCIVEVAVGGSHAILLAEGGRVFAVGGNSRGQLGLGDCDDREQPQLVLMNLGPGGTDYHPVCSGSAEAQATAAPSMAANWRRGGARRGSAMKSGKGSADRGARHVSLAASGGGGSGEGLGSPRSTSEGGAPWCVTAVACGREHTVLLARQVTSAGTTVGTSRVFVCGSWEASGLEDCEEDLQLPAVLPQCGGATAIAARGDASLCVAPAAAEEGGSQAAGPQLVYAWGEVNCCDCPDYLDVPTPIFQIPAPVRSLGLGAHFGLALDVHGEVYVWGDGTYGELGGADSKLAGGLPRSSISDGLRARSILRPEHGGLAPKDVELDVRVPGKVQLPTTISAKPSSSAVQARISAASSMATSASELPPVASPMNSPRAGGGDVGSESSYNWARPRSPRVPGGPDFGAGPLDTSENAEVNSTWMPDTTRPFSFAPQARKGPTPGGDEAPAAEVGPAEAAAMLRQRPRVVDIACGERHALLLDDLGRVYAFGENMAGQCGVPEAVGAGHVTGSVLRRPRAVPIEGGRHSADVAAGTASDGCSGSLGGGTSDFGGCVSGSSPPRPYELGARVFAGARHSGLVTQDNRLYLWGHPSNRKLGHAGYNADGTEAGEDPAKARPPGVAVRSSLRDAVRRPRLVYSMLHRRVRTLGLGDECTIIVSGDGVVRSLSANLERSAASSGFLERFLTRNDIEVRSEAPMQQEQSVEDVVIHVV